ncbi:hypothetical protein [Pseudomonas frederiksbergensis]|uniref:Uncharacterized protein n=1 Tax=Pseudomonas frederiksbergensis TaxID=104087 RepID=A0A423HTQ3_9PSED|nr:hypothetical protein [Pseudomonas frederiksbergensis]RON16579.1 hypothetical protein BK662_08615 [Pseudomonas frederiksbergensis]
MITSRLTALALTTLLTSVAFAATSSSGTDPTDPIERPESAATQGIDSGRSPSATATDPRIYHDDAGEMNTPSTQTPDNAGTGVGSKTTTGGSGSEGRSVNQ